MVLRNVKLTITINRKASKLNAQTKSEPNKFQFIFPTNGSFGNLEWKTLVFANLEKLVIKIFAVSSPTFRA